MTKAIQRIAFSAVAVLVLATSPALLSAQTGTDPVPPSPKPPAPPPPSPNRVAASDVIAAILLLYGLS